ncbi:MAG: hypothetical protein ACQEXJ_25100, partial [Myxococcota bacterium]
MLGLVLGPVSNEDTSGAKGVVVHIPSADIAWESAVRTGPITARQILRHLDLPAEPPRIAPARPPPDPELDL